MTPRADEGSMRDVVEWMTRPNGAPLDGHG